MSVDQVEQTNNQFYSAFEKNSIDEMETVWSHSDETECIHPGWELCTGWMAIRESWERIFQNSEPMKFIITNTRIHIDKEIAVVVCLENIQSETLGKESKFGILATNVFKFEDNNWLMIHHHGSPVANYFPPNIQTVDDE